MNQAQRGMGSLSAEAFSKSDTSGELGQGNKSQKNKNLPEVGQAHKLSQSIIKVLGLNEARLEKNSSYSSLGSAQAQYRHKGSQIFQKKTISGRDCPGFPVTDHYFSGSYVSGRDSPRLPVTGRDFSRFHVSGRFGSRRDCPWLPVIGRDLPGSQVLGRDFFGALVSLHSTGTHMLINSSGPGNIQKKPPSGRDCSGRSSVIYNQINESSGYFSDFEISAKKELGRRATSVPINQKEIKNQGSKVIKKVNPKPKENFGLGKILKRGDFSGQDSREMKENSNLSVLHPTNKNGHASNKPNSWTVYTRNYPRRLGGRTITKDSRSLRKHEDVVLGVCEGSEGEMGIKRSSSSDDDISSEDFVITSNTDVEAEKEIQEEAAFEGVRCLLGEGRKEFERVKGLEDTQVPN